MIVVMIMNDEAACIASVQNSLESKVLWAEEWSLPKLNSNDPLYFKDMQP